MAVTRNRRKDRNTGKPIYRNMKRRKRRKTVKNDRTGRALPPPESVNTILSSQKPKHRRFRSTRQNKYFAMKVIA
jgi:hypothetical protein